MSKTKKKVRYLWRDAGTGRVLSAAEAKQRPKNTVVRETVPKKKCD